MTGKSVGQGPRDELVLQLEPETSGGRHPCSAGPESLLLTSTDWARPTTSWRLMFYSKSADLNVHLIFKENVTETCRLAFDQTSEHCDLAKLTHTMNHHSIYRPRQVWAGPRAATHSNPQANEGSWASPQPGQGPAPHPCPEARPCGRGQGLKDATSWCLPRLGDCG